MHRSVTPHPERPKGQPEDLEPPIKDAHLYPHNRRQSVTLRPEKPSEGPGTGGQRPRPANDVQNVDAFRKSIVRLDSEAKKDVATEAVIALPSDAKKDVASAAMQTLSQEAKKDVASAAMQTLPQEAKKDAVTEMVQSLPREDQETVLRSIAPTQGAIDRIWLIIVGAFAIVFILSAIALFVSAFWSPGQIQVLLTVVTTVAGVLAGFVSGRASSSGTST